MGSHVDFEGGPGGVYLWLLFCLRSRVRGPLPRTSVQVAGICRRVLWAALVERYHKSTMVETGQAVAGFQQMKTGRWQAGPERNVTFGSPAERLSIPLGSGGRSVEYAPRWRDTARSDLYMGKSRLTAQQEKRRGMIQPLATDGLRERSPTGSTLR